MAVTTKGTAKDPVRLDLFQTIRNIQWGTSGFLVLEFRNELTGRQDEPAIVPVYVNNIPTGNIDLAGDVSGEPVESGFSNPFSDDQLEQRRIASEEFNDEETEDITDEFIVPDVQTWEGIVGGVQNHLFSVQLFPGTVEEAIEAMSSGYEFTYGHPPDNSNVPPDLGAFVNSVDEFHTETDTRTVYDTKHGVVVVYNMARVKSKLAEGRAPNAPPLTEMNFQVIAPRSAIGTTGKWTVAMKTYKKLKGLVLDAEKVVTGTNGGEEADSYTLESIGDDGSRVPGKRYEITLKFKGLEFEVEEFSNN